MSEPAPPTPPPAPPAPAPAAVPPPPPAPAAPSPRKRRWFNVFAAVVLAGFALFVAAITILSVLLPSFRGR